MVAAVDWSDEMKLVPEWRVAWRWFSVQLAAVLAALPMVWPLLPDDMKSYIPHEWHPWIVSGMALAIIAGRLVPQGAAK